MIIQLFMKNIPKWNHVVYFSTFYSPEDFDLIFEYK